MLPAHLFPRLCHGIVLYPPSRSFRSAGAGRGRPYAHVLLYLHRLSKEPDWSISRPELMFSELNQTCTVYLVVSCNDNLSPVIS